jgi:serine/threonine protein phosphatase PrpC
MNKGSLAFLTVANNRPHPDKLDKGGEDAWFIRTDANGGAFGVADGVGGYDEYGVDSGLFSKRLMQLAAEKDMEQVISSPCFPPKGDRGRPSSCGITHCRVNICSIFSSQ